MGLYEEVAKSELINQIIEEAETYKDENSLWSNSKEFGQWVINELQSFDNLNFNGEKDE